MKYSLFIIGLTLSPTLFILPIVKLLHPTHPFISFGLFSGLCGLFIASASMMYENLKEQKGAIK